MAQSTQTPIPRAQRFPLQLPLHYRKRGMQHWQDGKTINISRTGILFQADEKIPEDSILDIRISFPLKAMLSCQGSIVRVDEPAFAVRIHRYRMLRGQKTTTNSED